MHRQTLSVRILSWHQLGFAVVGSVSASGEFVAKAVLYAGLGPQAPQPKLETDKYVVLISGLNVSPEKQ